MHPGEGVGISKGEIQGVEKNRIEEYIKKENEQS